MNERPLWLSGETAPLLTPVVGAGVIESAPATPPEPFLADRGAAWSKSSRAASCPRTATQLVALAGIVALALALRLWLLDSQLPWAFHPDEGHYVWKALEMVESGNLNPKYFRNPSLFTYVLYGQYWLLEALDISLGSLVPTWEALQPPAVYLYLGRLTSALFGAATVAVVYCLGAVLFTRSIGLVGALLTAVSFIQVRDAHFATNDVAATFLLIVSVLFCALYWRAGRGWLLLLAALFGGLATSTKYNAGFFVVPLLAAYLPRQQRASLAPRRLIVLVGAGAVALGAYLVGTPFTILAWPTFVSDFRVQQRFSREGWEGQGPEPVGLLYLDALAHGLGWVALAFAVLGLVVMARRRPAAAVLLAGYPLVYLAYMLGVKLFFVRFAVTLAPFLCLAAAYGLVQVAGRWRRGTVLAPLLALAVAQPLWSDLQHGRILAQPDTRALALAWLEANVPPGARIIADEYTVRDRRPRADLPDRQHFDLDLENPLSARPLEHYRERGFEYAVVSSFQYRRFPGRHDTYAALDRDARLLAVFAPTWDGRELPFDVEELYSPFHGLERYARPGPTVKIYGLRP